MMQTDEMVRIWAAAFLGAAFSSMLERLRPRVARRWWSWRVQRRQRRIDRIITRFKAVEEGRSHLGRVRYACLVRRQRRAYRAAMRRRIERLEAIGRCKP